MADAAVEFLLVNLKEFLVYNVQLISSVKEEVNFLCNDLRLLAAVVKEKTKNQNSNAVVKALVEQIRTEVYKTEDVIDMYLFHASVKKSRTHILKKIFHVPADSMTLKSLGTEIQEIKARVRDIYRNEPFMKMLLKSTETPINPVQNVEEENVVAFDEEAKKLVGWLKAETEELEVISVVGMCGLGKTTLAKKVLNDPSIKDEFVCSLVHFSHVRNTREALLKILLDVNTKTKDTSPWSVIADELRNQTSELIAITEELRSKLRNVKYLIVLDALSTKETWFELRTVFPNVKNGSRILITTQNKDVATQAKKNFHPYQLLPRTDDESCNLFEKQFPIGNHSYELETLGKEIARKCYGLPLVIVVIAATLKDKDASYWERVKQDVNTYVAMEETLCMDVLASSYNQLTHDLRACFLYFGMFPKDFEIPVWKLIHMWVAEGFIQQTGNLSAEEMAEKSLVDLVNRSLVLVEQRRANGGIKTCRVHGLLHDVCVKLAKQENFFKEIKGLEQSIYNSTDPNIFRRLSIQSQVSDYVSSEPDSSHVRSLLCYGKEEDVDLIKYLGSFKLLRVLDVLPTTFTCFPIIQLVHLRYIALLGAFEVLPAAISNLWNLQTVIVETKSNKIEVEADLWKLLQLRHFYTSAASVLPTPRSHSQKGGKDPLVNKNLRTLSKVSPNSCTDVILSRTPNLKKLGVRGNLALLLEEKDGICKFDNITKLKHLEKLKLLNDTHPISPLDGGLPKFDKFPKMLTKLTFSDTMLDWGQMSVLGKLEALEVLKLGDNAFVGEQWVTVDNSFVKLRVLQIGKTNLVHWKAVGRQFFQLQRVSFMHCEQLVSIPSSLGHISTLKVMDFYCTPSVAVSRLTQKNFEPNVCLCKHHCLDLPKF